MSPLLDKQWLFIKSFCTTRNIFKPKRTEELEIVFLCVSWKSKITPYLNKQFASICISLAGDDCGPFHGFGHRATVPGRFGKCSCSQQLSPVICLRKIHIQKTCFCKQKRGLAVAWVPLQQVCSQLPSARGAPLCLCRCSQSRTSSLRELDEELLQLRVVGIQQTNHQQSSGIRLSLRTAFLSRNCKLFNHRQVGPK